MPDVRFCEKCKQWRNLYYEWPKDRLLDESAVCLICDKTGKYVIPKERLVEKRVAGPKSIEWEDLINPEPGKVIRLKKENDSS